jgi:hypothetical protein
MIKFVPIDLSKFDFDKYEHPDIKLHPVQYLLKEAETTFMRIGTFSRQWYGLSFRHQYGEQPNGHWEGLWEIQFIDDPLYTDLILAKEADDG